MKTALGQAMSKNAGWTPMGGSLCPTAERVSRVLGARRGRPERAIRTPVNIGNGPYRDNGEGVAQCHPLTH